MIIVRLCGGLGNQMFQYAAGLALARRHETELRLDLEWFEGNRIHQGLELPRVFALPIPEASPAEKKKVLGWLGAPWLRRVFSKPAMGALRPTHLAVEPHFHYWPGFEGLPADAYLAGYWQSERYFAVVADQIRALFRFAAPLDARSTQLARQMSVTTSVSLHVRRGDYVHNPQVRRIHGVDLTRYYQQAIDTIMDRVATPHFYVFSDEPGWVRTHLSIDASATFVDHNRGPDSYRDMQLMSLCKHHIIANSTFSWWGAWLNQDPKKIVIAPRQFFVDSAFDTKDLYCPGWLVI